jgi:alkyl hydroperoxide reductase subunit AhpC
MESKEDHRSLFLGEEFPNLEVKTQNGDFKLHDYQGDSWLMFFSHPRDFTPVCTTELGRVAKLLPEFEKRNCKVIALSCDSLDDHKKWICDVNETQKCEVTFPIISDPDLTLAKQIGMYHPKCDAKITVRTCFIIDPSKKVKLMIQYPPSTGRNFNEILRVLDSLQLTATKSVATPENWQCGDKCVILPTISNEVAKEKFPQGWDEVKPYLRLVDVEKN